MERIDRRRLRESGIPLDTSGPMHVFACGVGPANVGPIEPIPREKWQEEIASTAAEESDFWRGHTIPIRLMVELPFWLMLPDCDLQVAHQCARVAASIRGQYMAVYDGPLFLDSQGNVVFIGPNDDLQVGKDLPPPVAATKAPVYRPMKTVVVFSPEAIEDAVLALLDPEPLDIHQTREVRCLNRATLYLQSLAYAHLPLLNQLILSYRLVSRDPFAFQLSQWDVPVWFAEHNGRVVPVYLMPYKCADWYPTVKRLAAPTDSAFYATDPQTLDAQANADVAPGTSEILEAHGLLYRGRVEDAVRFAVTAIEVAIEGQIARLLAAKGYTNEQIATRLGETQNNFDKRVADYERISGARIPGPILSRLPHINGIRLKDELAAVRKLRHKIVHKGLRVGPHSRGPMVRAIETMTWLFNWLSWEEGKTQDRSRNYVFFEMLRGMHVPRYDAAYRECGVTVLPNSSSCDRIPTAEEAIWSQYLASIEPDRSDIELFVLMSLAYLQIDPLDTPPGTEEMGVYERYLIRDGERCAIVFCLESETAIDVRIMEAVVARLRQHRRQHVSGCKALCIINHQKNKPSRLREVKNAIPDAVNAIAKTSEVAIATALDLRLLVQGIRDYKWDVECLKSILFLPGRQGEVPPGYGRIGTYVHFYPRASVIAVELDQGASVRIGMRLGIRLPARYHEESIESLEVNHKAVPVATGPCTVGIKTTLDRSNVRRGQPVYVRLA